MTLENYVTPNAFFAWWEFKVSEDHPEMLERFFLTDEDKKVIRLMVQSIFDPWRLAHPDNPIDISSGKRSPELNDAVGGSPGSDHLTTSAIDSKARGMSAEEYFSSLLVMNPPYRQLILYPERHIVHCSINLPGKQFKHEWKIK